MASSGLQVLLYRAVPLGHAGSVSLQFRDQRIFDPKTAYKAADKKD